MMVLLIPKRLSTRRLAQFACLSTVASFQRGCMVPGFAAAFTPGAAAAAVVRVPGGGRWHSSPITTVLRSSSSSSSSSSTTTSLSREDHPFAREALEALAIKELKALARECGVSTEGCFEKRDMVDRVMSYDPAQAAAAAAAALSHGGAREAEVSGGGGITEAAGADSAAERDLSALSVRELRTMIHEAGLSSKGLFDKAEMLAKAQEAAAVLATRPRFPDAERYRALGVRFFGRTSCPYCVDALNVLRSRGLLDGKHGADDVMLDVEGSASAASEFRALGGEGVPFFHAAKTGKTAAGWRPGAEDAAWIAEALG